MSLGLVLQAIGSDDRVFFVRRGVRHYISDARWLGQSGFRWPENVVKVPPAVLQAFANGRPASLGYSVLDWNSPRRRSSIEMRAICASQLRGKGVEFGAGASPFPVPLACDVIYADMFSTDDLRKRLYPGQNPDDLVEVGMIADLDDMTRIEDASLDFIVACHVIEHTRDPIGAIVEAHRKLRCGGSLVLVVPDKER